MGKHERPLSQARTQGREEILAKIQCLGSSVRESAVDLMFNLVCMLPALRGKNDPIKILRLARWSGVTIPAM